MVVKLTVSEALPVMIAGFVHESARMSTKGATRRCRQVVRLEGMGGLCVAERVSGQVTATHYRVEGVKSGISVVWKTMG